MSSKNKKKSNGVTPPGVAQKVTPEAPRVEPKAEPEEDAEEELDDELEAKAKADAKAKAEADAEAKAEADAKAKAKGPKVAEKVSIAGQGGVIDAGQPICPADIHSDPIVAKEHFDILVEKKLIVIE